MGIISYCNWKGKFFWLHYLAWKTSKGATYKMMHSQGIPISWMISRKSIRRIASVNENSLHNTLVNWHSNCQRLSQCSSLVLLRDVSGLNIMYDANNFHLWGAWISLDGFFILIRSFLWCAYSHCSSGGSLMNELLQLFPSDCVLSLFFQFFAVLNIMAIISMKVIVFGPVHLTRRRKNLGWWLQYSQRFYLLQYFWLGSAQWCVVSVTGTFKLLGPRQSWILGFVFVSAGLDFFVLWYSFA